MTEHEIRLLSEKIVNEMLDKRADELSKGMQSVHRSMSANFFGKSPNKEFLGGRANLLMPEKKTWFGSILGKRR